MDPTRLKLFKKTTYWKETNAIVQHCMAVAEEKGLNTTQLALVCDLARVTVNNNSNEQVGLRQELTLWKLCAGVGLQLEMIDRSRNGLKVQHEMEGIRKALDRKPAKSLTRSKKRRGKRAKR
jgi:hypothetical protein